jgi:hypothetical protein
MTRNEPLTKEAAPGLGDNPTSAAVQPLGRVGEVLTDEMPENVAVVFLLGA